MFPKKKKNQVFCGENNLNIHLLGNSLLCCIIVMEINYIVLKQYDIFE